mmetsp:Transcript_1182/g.3348  ORF Transcript_1182/g.3348 Transcript_1182/m.3348 type:complete len:210 (+) Transcript_1182:1358-1987(+)
MPSTAWRSCWSLPRLCGCASAAPTCRAPTGCRCPPGAAWPCCCPRRCCCCTCWPCPSWRWTSPPWRPPAARWCWGWCCTRCCRRRAHAGGASLVTFTLTPITYLGHACTARTAGRSTTTGWWAWTATTRATVAAATWVTRWRCGGSWRPHTGATGWWARPRTWSRRGRRARPQPQPQHAGATGACTRTRTRRAQAAWVQRVRRGRLRCE